MCSSARSNAAAACSRRPSAASVRPRARASFAIADGRPRSRGQRLVRPQERVGVLGPAERRRAPRRRGPATARSPARRPPGWGSARRPARAPPARPRRRRARSPRARARCRPPPRRSTGSRRLGGRHARVGVRGRPVAAGGGDADHRPPHERGVGVLGLRHERQRLLGRDDGVRPVAGGELRAGEDGQVHRADEQRARAAARSRPPPRGRRGRARGRPRRSAASRACRAGAGRRRRGRWSSPPPAAR